MEANEAVASRETLAPFLRRAELDPLIAIAMRGVTLPAGGWNPAARPSYRREAIEQLLVWLVPTGVCWYIWPSLAMACALLAVVSMVAAMMRVSRFQWVAFDGAVALRTGWLWRRTTMTRHDRIQLAMLTESPFDRRHGMARVSVDTAGSEAPQLDFDLLTRTDAETLVAQLDAGIADTEFTL
jgi:putative membrane protein